MRIGQARRIFVQRCKSEGLSKHTVTFYRNQVRYYWAWLCGRQRAQKWLEVEVLREYFAMQQKRVDKGSLQPESAEASYRALRALCRWLLKEEKIDVNPFSKIKRPKVPDKQPRRIDIEEHKQLVLSIETNSWIDLRDRLIVITLFWTGVRVGELINLHISDLDTEKSFLIVRKMKGGDPHYVPLLPIVKFAFMAYLFERPSARTDFLFLGANGFGDALDRPLLDSGVRLMLKRRCAVAGIKRKNPHAFRHGIAMHLLNELGADMSFISELLGHKDEKTTRDFYATWQIRGMAEKYAKLAKGSSK